MEEIKENKKFICQECKAMLDKADMFHPYLHCLIAKAHPKGWREIVDDYDNKIKNEN